MFLFNTHRLRYALLLAVALIATESVAQFSPKTLRVAVYNEAFGVPWGPITKLPIHPTVSLGTDFRVRSGKHWQKALGLDLYYYYQRSFEHALMLDVAYRLGYRFNFGLQANFHTALGYKHAILAGKKYSLKDGEYQPTSHFGKAQANLKVGLGLEYPLSKRYSITADYKAMAVAPFGDRLLPFSANTFLGVGLNIHLKP